MTMPRPKQYENNAARQAAYRERHAHQQPPREALLAALSRTLHSTIRDAAIGGNALAATVLGQGSDETLRKLIVHFKDTAG